LLDSAAAMAVGALSASGAAAGTLSTIGGTEAGAIRRGLDRGGVAALTVAGAGCGSAATGLGLETLASSTSLTRSTGRSWPETGWIRRQTPSSAACAKPDPSAQCAQRPFDSSALRDSFRISIANLPSVASGQHLPCRADVDRR